MAECRNDAQKAEGRGYMMEYRTTQNIGHRTNSHDGQGFTSRRQADSKDITTEVSDRPSG